MGWATSLTHIFAVCLVKLINVDSYIGDAKYGRLVGTDQFGNRYFEQLDPKEELPGQYHLFRIVRCCGCGRS